jgi:hypothetical protein
MKRSFELSRHRRANVWLDEAPPAAYIAASVMTKVVVPRVAIYAGEELPASRSTFPTDRWLHMLFSAANSSRRM